VRSSRRERNRIRRKGTRVKIHFIQPYFSDDDNDEMYFGANSKDEKYIHGVETLWAKDISSEELARSKFAATGVPMYARQSHMPEIAKCKEDLKLCVQPTDEDLYCPAEVIRSTTFNNHDVPKFYPVLITRECSDQVKKIYLRGTRMDDWVRLLAGHLPRECAYNVLLTKTAAQTKKRPAFY